MALELPVRGPSTDVSFNRYNTSSEPTFVNVEMMPCRDLVVRSVPVDRLHLNDASANDSAISTWRAGFNQEVDFQNLFQIPITTGDA